MNNKLISELYNKIDALEKINKEQVLEIARLKEKIANIRNYIKWHYDLGTKEEISFCILRDNLLEILGDKENE